MIRTGGRVAAAILLLCCGTLLRAHPAAASLPDSAAIEGVVLDAGTRHPLAGVVVRLVALNRQEITHENGEFHFIGVPHGRYTLLFERLGYRREVRQVSVETGQRVRVRVELQVSAIELPGLVVTGTVGSRLGDDAVRPVDVVAGAELGRKLDLTVAGTLEREPGLAATSLGPATARPIIRGLSGDRVLILEDGVRPGDLSTASPDHALAIDPLNAQRLEVVRGPTALLYGSNAIGGVVNVIRDQVPGSPPDRATGSVTLQGESVNDGMAAGGVTTVGIGSVAVRAEGSIRDAASTRTPDGWLDNTQLRSWNLAGGAGTGGSWGHAGVGYRYYDNEYGIPPEPDGEEAGVSIAMRRHAVQARAEVHGHIGPYSGFSLNTAYTDYFHQEIEPEGEVGTEYALRAAAADLVARHEAAGPFSSGAIGARVEWQDYSAGGSTETPPARELSIAGFVLEELDIGHLRLQAGARYDVRRVEPDEADYDAEIGAIRTRTFGSVSGSFGALYALTRTVRVGASVARAYRTPGIAELFSRGPHLASYSFEVGNPDLRAETGLGVDGFVRITTPRLNAEVAAFRNQLDHYIYYRNTGRPSPAELPVYQATGSDAVLSGAEGSMEWLLLPSVVLDGVVSWVRGDYASEDGDRPLPMMPPLHGRLDLRFERPEWFLSMGWEGAAEQDRVEEPETPTPGYGAFNASAGYRFQLWNRVHSLTLRADNLTDELYFNHLSRTKDLFPEPGRNLALVYRVVF